MIKEKVELNNKTLLVFLLIAFR